MFRRGKTNINGAAEYTQPGTSSASSSVVRSTVTSAVRCKVMWRSQILGALEPEARLGSPLGRQFAGLLIMGLILASRDIVLPSGCPDFLPLPSCQLDLARCAGV